MDEIILSIFLRILLFQQENICFMLFFHPTVYHNYYSMQEIYFSTHVHHFI